MSNWEELYARCYQRAVQPCTRFLTTDPRMAVALAYEDGMRTQSIADLYEAGKEGKSRVQSTRLRAARNARVAGQISMPSTTRYAATSMVCSIPIRCHTPSIIMTLAPAVKESIGQACKGEVYDMLYTRVRMVLAE